MQVDLPAQFERALRVIHEQLADLGSPWGITGSLGMRLQGMPLEVHDIDLQTDRPGAYAIQARLAASAQGSILLPVEFRVTESVRSHFGRLEIAGVTVEVMGDISTRLAGEEWGAPPDLTGNLRWVTYHGLDLPVLDLAYEYHAYMRLGRAQRSAEIQRFLEQRSADPD